MRILGSTPCAVLATGLLAGPVRAGELPRPPADSYAARWEADIRAFEAADATHRPPADPVLFVGSSSIRLWPSLAQDFRGLPVLQRGFGGCHLSDCVAYADRIVTPYRPRVVVLYAGDNDVAAGKSPEQVAEDFRAFARRVHAAQPRVRILFLAIKPSPARWHLVEKARAANRLVARLAAQDRRLVYVDVFTPMLGADGQPRPELYVKDRLHLSEAGYALWAERVRRQLAVLGLPVKLTDARPNISPRFARASPLQSEREIFGLAAVR